nr:cold-induced thioredoxin domain-containing protein [Cryptococcus depauperatus CBS 7855]
MTSSSAGSSLPLTNVLGKSKSPYLLQHKDNPVAWQEWSPETIALAQRLDKPIFLSSGYSACHWCHVLAHESFEDKDTAKLMNDWFVNIKVDREERPDVDRMYMSYLQASSGGGGWPMSIFMTPKLEPFFAGTYFPRASFQALLVKIHELWAEDREKCEQLGQGVIEALKDIGNSPGMGESLSEIMKTSPASKLLTQLSSMYDPRYGGFSSSGASSRGPKFPSLSNTLEPLARIASLPPSSHGDKDVREEAREMGMMMLRGIWKGGIRDWVGGGVARYSVDEAWVVPHFEKMLYDQAQLISSALDFARLYPPGHSDRELCEDLAADILTYSLRDLRSQEGGFWSAEDADSAPSPGAKKTEGAFYIWSKSELDEVLKEDANIVESFFGIKDNGNVNSVHDSHGEMRGKNILHQVKTYAEVGLQVGVSPEQVKEAVQRGCKNLKERRDGRERPGLDDKILAGWNGLMLSALAKAAIHLPKDYPIMKQLLPAAMGIVEFIKKNMWDSTTQVLSRSYRRSKGPQGQTDDYAFLVQGLLHLYEATGDESCLLFAEELQEKQDEFFWDEAEGGYFASAEDPHVLVRMKDAQDGAEPSAASISAHNLSRLSLFLSSKAQQYQQQAEKTWVSMGQLIVQHPRAVGYAVSGLIDLEKGWREVIIIGAREEHTTQEFFRLVWQKYYPNQVLIHIDPGNLPMALAERNTVVKALVQDIQNGKEVGSSLRLCQQGSCGLPVREASDAAEILGQ